MTQGHTWCFRLLLLVYTFLSSMSNPVYFFAIEKKPKLRIVHSEMSLLTYYNDYFSHRTLEYDASIMMLHRD